MICIYIYINVMGFPVVSMRSLKMKESARHLFVFFLYSVMFDLGFLKMLFGGEQKKWEILGIYYTINSLEHTDLSPMNQIYIYR